ncbi:melibiase [Promicromonospora sp. AC04]|uniref:alpha-galactosidase n=1 Tax=Promicromonospora sp. AC04 TaxID=2135723 RepID=UPI000D48C745|nr:alpha-galactosidase [Promicromonospora sp. AC04]PUB20198.1 melibiase [Promicromonospora sp. AC04]
MLAAISALNAEHRLDYIKWDQNGDLIEAVDAAGGANVHRHTEAVYRLLAALKARHPDLEQLDNLLDPGVFVSARPISPVETSGRCSDTSGWDIAGTSRVSDSELSGLLPGMTPTMIPG